MACLERSIQKKITLVQYFFKNVVYLLHRLRNLNSQGAQPKIVKSNPQYRLLQKVTETNLSRSKIGTAYILLFIPSFLYPALINRSICFTFTACQKNYFY